jgi:hypothetical protein
MLDCIRDDGHVEQMSMMLRYVDTEKACTEKQLAVFVAVEEATVSVLNDTILRETELLGLSINDCRRQDYSEGHMTGVNTVVKTYISHKFKTFFFTPYALHI